MLEQPKKKLLLAVICCHHRAHHTNAIREYWASEVKNKFGYKFFYGRGAHEPLQADEVVLDTDDAYKGLAEKVQASVQWALANGYDAYFKIDDDGAWIADRIYKAVNKDWFEYDYVGRVNGKTDRYHESTYCRGGTGYYLSKQAMEYIANQPKPNPEIARDYAEDSFIGSRLEEGGFKAVNDDRLRCADFSGPNRGPRPMNSTSWKRDCPTQSNDIITTCEFLGPEMRGVYDEWIKSREKYFELMSKIRV